MRALGSIRFTLLLLILVALFVTAGTWIEASADSHLRAERIAYKQPAFLLLLAALFLNILIAALNRWPWKIRHIPFLSAHLGLLMILAATAIKSLWGLQGVMSIAKGASSETVWLPGTFALNIDEESYPIPKDATLFAHCSEELLLAFEGEEKIGPVTLEIQERGVILMGPSGERHLFPVPQTRVVAIDGGLSGYEAYFELPIERLSLLPRERLARQLERLKGRGQLAEPLHLLAKEDGFGDDFVEWLEGWQESGEWLYPVDASLPIGIKERLKSLVWEALPYRLRAGMEWSSRLLQSSPEEIAARGWPIDFDGPEDLCRQLFEIGDLLPIPHTPASTRERAHLLSSYLRASGIDLDQLDAIDEEEELTPFTWPLARRLKQEPPLKKAEENRPLLVLEEGVALPYDPTGRGLSWPVHGKMMRFEPKRKRLPYSLHLQEARTLYYPGTNQPYSYEADLLIGSDLKTISMNRVWEDPDGRRFYLSRISEGSVDFAVSSNPAKKTLLYPGMILICFGIASLYPMCARRSRGSVPSQPSSPQK